MSLQTPMRLAFYIAQKGKLFDQLIARFDGGRFSHVELVFPWGNCLSSSSRDGGVRFKRIEFEPEKWEFVDLRLTQRQIDEIYWFGLSKCGAKYDYAGVLGFPIFFVRQDGRRWFCSELCAAALQSVGAIAADEDAWEISPNRLFEIVTAHESARIGTKGTGNSQLATGNSSGNPVHETESRGWL